MAVGITLTKYGSCNDGGSIGFCVCFSSRHSTTLQNPLLAILHLLNPIYYFVMSEYEPKKSLGQHWLNDVDVLQDIVASAAVEAGDTVVEIGPGLGTLTTQLLATGAKVIAIEFDETLLGNLKAKFAENTNFTLLHEDILKLDFSILPTNYKIVANIPYYLTSQLLRILSDTPFKPVTAALLMQKEVTERVCATPNDMSILAIAVQTEYDASSDIFVPAHMFTPPPKVDSLVLILNKINSLVPAPERREFMKVVKAGFSAKRKTLRNTISAGLQLTKPQAEELLNSANISPDRRAETVSLPEWLKVYTIYKNLTR